MIKGIVQAFRLPFLSASILPFIFGSIVVKGNFNLIGFICGLLVVAVLKVHLGKGFFLANGGFEYNFVIICVCIALMVLGAGKLAITRKF